MTFSGTLAAINAALDGATYHPGLHYQGTDEITIDVDDNGHSGGAAQSVTGTLEHRRQRRQPEPVRARTHGGGRKLCREQRALGGDAGRHHHRSGQSGGLCGWIADAGGRRQRQSEINIIPTSGFTVSGADLIYGGGAIGTIDGLGTGIVIVSGLTALATPSAVDALASAFNFDVAGDDPVAGDRTVVLVFRDGGNLGSSNTQLLHVVAVNDPPAAAVPGVQAGTEDTDLVFGTAHGNAIIISDPDAGSSGIVSVQLDVAHGTLTPRRRRAELLVGNGRSPPTRSRLAAVNAALDRLVYDFGAQCPASTNDVIVVDNWS